MNRLMITVALLALCLSVSEVSAQTWMFQPSTYSKTYGPQAPASTPKVGVYATFTESQAEQAARMPKPAFQWDPTGVLGRGQRYEEWSHEEAMEANRLQTYAQGVRDAVGAPLWSWNGLPAQPLPQIVAPTANSPGKARPAPRR